MLFSLVYVTSLMLMMMRCGAMRSSVTNIATMRSRLMTSLSRSHRSLGTTSAAASVVTMMSEVAPVSYKVGFMFPGQGAQAVGMAVGLCNEIPAAKALFDKASVILGYDLLAKCRDGPKEELDSTVISQPAIFVSSMAALEKLKLDDPSAIEQCTVAMGLSLGEFVDQLPHDYRYGSSCNDAIYHLIASSIQGEYTALCFAGAFSFEDGVKLTKARGEAMQAAADASQCSLQLLPTCLLT